jgi:hypothetical protein
MRVWLLLVLIALVPLRGSLAATMLCHDGAALAHATTAVHGAEHMQHEHRHLSMPAGHHHALGAADKCNVCSGLASPACPLDARSAAPVLPAGSTLVPLATAWPASFVPAKLKRPPRTI